MSVVFIASDHVDDQYLYRQAFGEVGPTCVLYFFMHKAELIHALQGEVYPEPSLLLMDWNMDNCDGYALLILLAQAPAWQTIPVVILDTPDRPVNEARCQEIGYDLVLPKETGYDKVVQQLSGLLHALL
ncbi:MAG: response regulator receiver protein [Spirosoma sp.]|nr:response regulator receiver protein [Spirosoma sp.]